MARIHGAGPAGEVPRPRRQVAIVGGAPSRRLAPYGDPAWDIWAFSSLKLHTPRITRWFEMHALEDLRQQLWRETPYKRSFTAYMAFLQGLECPVYMQRIHPAIPNSVQYPLEEALQAFGRCFTSTASYMIALAILENYGTIGVWGVHLSARTVYARQRPGVEYLLGVAKQRGLDVYIPPASPLRVPGRPRFVPTPVLYGYDWRSSRAWWRKAALAGREGRTGRRRPG